MADRSIGQLTEATSIGATDLLIMEQAGTAKKVQGRTLLEWVDGHGGLAGVSFGDDYTVTFLATDGTTWTSPSLRGATGETGDQGPRGIHGSGVSVTVAEVAGTTEHPNGGQKLTIKETVYGEDGSPASENTLERYIWNGNKGETGATGATGPKGDPGNSYVVKGLYATLSALQAAHPTGSEGDAWFVGTSDSNVVYQWDVDKAAWVNAGALKGPTGNTGATGAQGEPGADGKSAYEAAQDGGYTGTETAFNAALAQVANKVDKSTIVDVTLLAANWSGSAAPYTYTATVAGVTTTSTQDWVNSTSITEEQLKAWQAANIVDGGQGVGFVTFKAFGTKPTVNIPLRCILRKDT